MGEIHEKIDRVRSGANLGLSEPVSDPVKLTIIIPDVGPSFNAYQNIYYKERGRLVRRWNDLVGWEVTLQKLLPVTEYPVCIHCKCYFGKGRKCYDWVNLSTTAKLIEDGLRHAGILKEDSKQFIAWGKLEAIKTKGDTYTEFVIESV